MVKLTIKPTAERHATATGGTAQARKGVAAFYDMAGGPQQKGAVAVAIPAAGCTFYATEHAVVVEYFSGTNALWICIFLTALNLNQYATSTAQPGLAVSNINNVLIPVPPVVEQQRIVNKIDKLHNNMQKMNLIKQI